MNEINLICIQINQLTLLIHREEQKNQQGFKN